MLKPFDYAYGAKLLTFTWIEQVHATTESALISSMKVFGEFVLLKQKRHVLEAPRLDACIAALSWWLLGWGVAYGAVPQYGPGEREGAHSYILS